LLYFFIGVVFVLIVLPLFSCVSLLFEAIFNFFISIFNFLAAKVNSKIVLIQREVSQGEECESHPTNLIGFQSYPKEEYYDEDDDDE